MTHPIHSADADVITASGDRINWTRNGVLVVERTFFGAEKVLFDRLAAEKRKSLELQRVYEERGLQIGRLETAMERLRAAAQVGANGVAAILALADKWNHEAIAAGFAGSDEAYALYEILGDFRAAGAPASHMDLMDDNSHEEGRHTICTTLPRKHGCIPNPNHLVDESALQELVDQAQELDMGYGAPAETPKPATERLASKMQEMGVTIRSYFPGSNPNATAEQVAAEMLKALEQIDATAAATIGAGEGKDALDAARWRALLASDRIRMLGSAGLNTPMANNYAHFGMEIWTHFGADSERQLKLMAEGNTLGREWLTKYADIAIEAQRAAMRSKTSPGEAG